MTCLSHDGGLIMLSNKNALANIAVKNLEISRKFYETILGLEVIGSVGEEVVVYRCGNAAMIVYQSQYAGTNKATSATWVVGEDMDVLVKELKSKGVQFEHYDMPNTTLKGDIHFDGDMKVAWFKDPDGNILNIINK
ncbi:Glyoxalase/bleomycin resistance protein/dioxygenase [Candidatus Nitrosocosmicus arcticus]|uniref:Glyoxalase/bleomycin resistance protein/dioxygenase n=2 Tax=Candidatus Nitrosocosmicus arcticus TaxID=2035267 RepID=A0A557SWC5_9ARCH|nr:Glyoxalase/bleomycin resistance protein/dioxygenase [Candidatus Nitrosocosmicus arcticus]